jgi:C4-dicarboxylate-binding protein DctP
MHRTALFILLALLISAPALHASEEAKTLNLALPDSADKSVRDVAAEFKKAVESQTGGAVTIELDQTASYGDNEIVSVAAAGTVDIGGTSLSQFAYDVPLAGVFLQPFMFNFNALVRAAARPDSEIRALIDEEILYWTNTRVLWWQPYGSNVIFSKGGLADGVSITGLPIGSPDDQSKELTRACGGNAYLIPTAQLHAALESGQIRAAMTDILGVKVHDLWQVADTIVNTQHAPSLYLVVINDRVWNGLPPGQQDILIKVAKDIQAQTWERFVAIEKNAYELAMKKGMKIHDLTPQDVEAWRACSSPLLESYMERIGEPGQKLFIAYGKLRTDPCCQEAPSGKQAIE